jgi:hypothetical protein
VRRPKNFEQLEAEIFATIRRTAWRHGAKMLCDIPAGDNLNAWSLTYNLAWRRHCVCLATWLAATLIALTSTICVLSTSYKNLYAYTYIGATFLFLLTSIFEDKLFPLADYKKMRYDIEVELGKLGVKTIYRKDGTAQIILREGDQYYS